MHLFNLHPARLLICQCCYPAVATRLDAVSECLRLEKSHWFSETLPGGGEHSFHLQSTGFKGQEAVQIKLVEQNDLVENVSG